MRIRNSDPHKVRVATLFSYLGEGPLGEAAGGHGVPLGATPAVDPWLFPEVEGDEPELEDPVFGVEESGVPLVLGNVPHGEPLGLVPEVLGGFGFIVGGWALLPGAAGFCGFW